MGVQGIKNNDQPQYAVVPYEDYIELVEKAELLQDIQDYDSAKAALEHVEEELVPAEVLYAIMDGGNPIKVWREYRGMTQQQLAEQVGISVPYLSQLETEKRKGSLEVIAAIAKALHVSLDLFVE